jgi:hypothetical protein
MSEAALGPNASKEELCLGFRRCANGQPPLFLQFQKLCHHAAILAGSGAGKSTLVGRIVEEIVLKTEARVVIIDTNGDFRKAHIINNSNYEKNVAGVPPDDTYYRREPFEERWRKLRKLHLTYAHSGPTDGIEWSKPFLSWNRLDMQWQMDVLKLELSRNP